MATIQGIYVALFGRPADPLGLAFFNSETGNGADLTAIGDLSNTPEYLNRFEGDTSAQIITEIYNSLFNRNPELAGLEFFVAELESGRQTINTIAINILDGAQGDDLATSNNKTTAANNFTDAINTPDELASYQGDAAAAQGRAFLAPVTNDPDTIPTAEETAEAVANIQANPEFVLTTGIDFADGVSASRNGGPLNPSGTPSDFRFTDTNQTVKGDAATIGNFGIGGVDTLADVSTTDNDTFIGTLTGAGAVALGLYSNIENYKLSVNGFNGGAVDFSTVSGGRSISLSGNLAAGLTLSAVALANGLAGAGITSVDGSGLANITNGLTVDLSGTAGTTAVTITGGAAGDTLTGADGADTINGGGGADVIVAGSGNDTVDGGAGNDTITGESGADKLSGGAGNDNVDGGLGDDTLNGDAGNDTLTGGDGNDTINGGDGDDNIDGGAGDDTVDGGAGDDIINTFAGADKVNGGDGADTIDSGTGNDTVDGGAGNDNIISGTGNDSVTGGAGDDVIDAGSGNDTVTAGAGDDTITLGTGKDTVVFEALGGNGNDNITDFSLANDKIDLPVDAYVDVAAGLIGGLGFNAVDFNLINVAADPAFDDAADIQALVGTDPGDLKLKLSSTSVVVVDNGANSLIFEVQVDGLGQAVGVTQIAQLVSGLAQDNFI